MDTLQGMMHRSTNEKYSTAAHVLYLLDIVYSRRLLFSRWTMAVNKC